MALLTAALLPLAACGSGTTETQSNVSMKDLEVVDGTASDAMTDLDGVRSEGTALAPTGESNSTPAATRTAANNASAPADVADTEVIADQ
ncbi:hypothetical protein [Sphingobium algorifonticola]|uniref:hypothetical protein n=1 Tax=Sphingobium algorifonticola TaxID=2008318 RepID=UPI003B97C49B